MEGCRLPVAGEVSLVFSHTSMAERSYVCLRLGLRLGPELGSGLGFGSELGLGLGPGSR